LKQHDDQYMAAWRDFLLLLVCRPDRLLAVLWWRICGKRLRARYRLRDAIGSLPFANARSIDRLGKADLASLRDQGTHGRAPTFCVHLHLPEGLDPAAAKRALTSALVQSHTPLRIFLTGEVLPNQSAKHRIIEKIEGHFDSTSAAFLECLAHAALADADYLVPLSPRAVLPRHAVAGYAANTCDLVRGQGLPLLYGDQDESGFRRMGKNPWLKPDWDRRMFLSQDYLTAACAVPVMSALDYLDDPTSPKPVSFYELLLRLVSGEDALPVRHVLRITARTARDRWKQRSKKRAAALANVLPSGTGIADGPFGTMRICWPLPADLPLVSILVATRDRVDLLRTCMEGLLHGTDYPNLEIVIADNDSREPSTLQYLEEVVEDPRVRVVRWPHPFNYSAINNFAAGFANGQLLCLLNNDIEIVEPDWLTEMVREILQPGVGAVGARLLYPDRSIQHAGVAIGIGNAAGHAHRALPEGAPGYFAQALIARGASAVTGACLLVQKRSFEAVGGLDEVRLAVAYNDVDFCLKLRKLGLRNIYTPAATLIHHESKSRGSDFAPEHNERYMRELAVFQERWGTKQIIDPWHHPRLERGSEDYRIQSCNQPLADVG